MRTRSGFTLVEVLVAVTILTVGVVAMAGSTATVTRMINRGKVDTRAAQLATQRMEELRRIAYSTSRLSRECGDHGLVDRGSGAHGPDAERRFRLRDASRTSQSGAHLLRRVLTLCPDPAVSRWSRFCLRSSSWVW
jgi:prepilin-type N-terminal cleavage/methylation domain-containing protein